MMLCFVVKILFVVVAFGGQCIVSLFFFLHFTNFLHIRVCMYLVSEADSQMTTEYHFCFYCYLRYV